MFAGYIALTEWRRVRKADAVIVEEAGERWHRSKTKEISEIDEIAQWLLDKLPPEPDPEAGRPATLVHNDFKLDNVMLNPQDPSQVVAVLDWEMCTVGDPLVDSYLAFVAAYAAGKDDEWWSE